MFRQLLQRLLGSGATPAEESVRQEEVDAKLGLVNGEGVMPDGEVAHFDSDEEPPPETPA